MATPEFVAFHCREKSQDFRTPYFLQEPSSGIEHIIRMPPEISLEVTHVVFLANDGSDNYKYIIVFVCSNESELQVYFSISGIFPYDHEVHDQMKDKIKSLLNFLLEHFKECTQITAHVLCVYRENGFDNCYLLELLNDSGFCTENNKSFEEIEEQHYSYNDIGNDLFDSQMDVGNLVIKMTYRKADIPGSNK